MQLLMLHLQVCEHWIESSASPLISYWTVSVSCLLQEQRVHDINLDGKESVKAYFFKHWTYPANIVESSSSPRHKSTQRRCLQHKTCIHVCKSCVIWSISLARQCMQPRKNRQNFTVLASKWIENCCLLMILLLAECSGVQIQRTSSSWAVCLLLLRPQSKNQHST